MVISDPRKKATPTARNMLRLTKIFTALVLAVISVITQTVFIYSASPSYNVSSYYKNSVYYQNLLSVDLSGDNRSDIVTVALSQIGYHEGNSTSQFHGTNGSGTGNFTEFNYLFGKLDGNGDGSVEYGYAWCAAFVSWCARQAGVKKSVLASYASCTLWVDYFRQRQQYFSRASGYVPKTGDIIFFRQPTTQRTSDHVGIVIYSDGNNVYTIEGNTSNQVKRRSYKLSDTYIIGYGVPSYETAEPYTDFSLPNGYTSGQYIVTTASLNLRSGVGTSYASLARIPLGRLVTVTKVSSGWGKITYEGIEGWISLDYTSIVSTSPKYTFVPETETPTETESVTENESVLGASPTETESESESSLIPSPDILPDSTEFDSNAGSSGLFSSRRFPLFVAIAAAVGLLASGSAFFMIKRRQRSQKHK